MVKATTTAKPGTGRAKKPAGKPAQIIKPQSVGKTTDLVKAFDPPDAAPASGAAQDAAGGDPGLTVTIHRDDPSAALPDATGAALGAIVKAATDQMGEAFNVPAALLGEPGKTFPIMGHRSRSLKAIPWALAEQARIRIEARFKLPLERLAALGGLEAIEFAKAFDPDHFGPGRRSTTEEAETMIREAAESLAPGGDDEDAD